MDKKIDKQYTIKFYIYRDVLLYLVLTQEQNLKNKDTAFNI